MSRRELNWLRTQELSPELVEAVYERFHEAFDTDDSRDHGEFLRMLSKYQAGSSDYRRGMDRAMTALTGYRLISIMKLASGIPEEDL